MSNVIELSVSFETITCHKCAGVYALTERFTKERRVMVLSLLRPKNDFRGARNRPFAQ